MIENQTRIFDILKREVIGRDKKTMSMEPPRENPSTYFVQDRGNLQEMHRLEIQDKMLTSGMGGVLPELDEPLPTLRRVLDVGCGTGGWLIETARTYPTIERLVGADISSTILAHARAQAGSLGLGEQVQFKAMDALRALDFANGSFDLVNQRAGLSWLRTWEWTKLLLEYRRVCRPGGLIRITENNVSIECNSLALTKLWEVSLEVCYNSGRLFTKSPNGLTSELVRLLTQHGIQDVKSRVHTLVYRTGTETGEYFYKDMLHGFHVALPFFQKWTRVPSDYQEIYQQALKEMRAADFVATWTWLSAWGTRPEDGQTIRMRGLY